jgi:superfamily II DNA/RNA helicase
MKETIDTVIDQASIKKTGSDITFESLGLVENLLKAVTELGFVNPTAIQEKAVRYY